MKKLLSEFIRRGMIGCGFGPLVLAVLYLILQNQCALETLTINQVCIGIFSLSALAFIAGGMNAIYQIEHLPLMAAISIHGFVLYCSYLVTYLINGWLKLGIVPLLVFTAIFVAGYLVVWAIIYIIIRKNTAQLNEVLQQKQHSDEG